MRCKDAQKQLARTSLKDDSKDLPYTRYTALAAEGGTDGGISVHRFTVSNEL